MVGQACKMRTNLNRFISLVIVVWVVCFVYFPYYVKSLIHINPIFYVFAEINVRQASPVQPTTKFIRYL